MSGDALAKAAGLAAARVHVLSVAILLRGLLRILARQVSQARRGAMDRTLEIPAVLDDIITWKMQKSACKAVDPAKWSAKLPVGYLFSRSGQHCVEFGQIG